MLRLLVLDAIVDDWDTIKTLRDRGESGTRGMASLGDAEIVEALEHLLAKGEVEAFRENSADAIADPFTEPTQYVSEIWFRITDIGRDTARAGAHALDAWYRSQGE